MARRTNSCGRTARGRVDFLPPEIRAGSLPKPKGTFMLDIWRAISCVGRCNRTQPGRFE